MKRKLLRNLMGTVPLMAALILLLPHSSVCRGGGIESLGGVGVLGDSYSDEYEFYPPDRSKALNWVEILARTRQVNFGRYSVLSRGEPRNQGFEFNWARSDATTTDMIKTGQHTGLAAQVARGEVSTVIIFIGGNDFIYALQSSEAATLVQPVLTQAMANLHVAVETILQANSHVHVLIATLPSILELPEFAAPLSSGRISHSVASAFERAIERYNGEIRLLALRNPRIVLLDLALIARLAPKPDQDHVRVWGHTLDRVRPINEPDHVFLGDSRHVGTLVQGVMADLVIHTLNARLDARIAPLRAAEVFDLARPQVQLAKQEHTALLPRPD
jgi:hypothetical protein